jgi:hypothetical protein
MRVRSVFENTARKVLALVTGVVMIFGGASAALAQSSTGTIAGVIVDPSGHPAEGFKITVRDVASNIEYTSEPTDASGGYSVQVPLGGRYKIEGVIAADGVTKLPVQDIPPVSVLTAGTTRMNVRFANVAPAAETTAAGSTASAASTAATASTTTTEEDNNKKKKGAVPWYKRPGPIVGIVLGAVAIAAIALSGGSSSNNNASPSTP